MPGIGILKHFLEPSADSYVLPMVRDLVLDEKPKSAEEPPEKTELPMTEEGEEPAGEELPPEEDPLAYARAEAEALMQRAEQDAELYRQEALEKLQKELEEERAAARDEGYAKGFSQGMSAAMEQAAQERTRLAEQQVREIREFLEEAARARDRIFDENREELKDLALAVAEKVIKVSLQNSSDILLRMVDAATDTHKRCEWARIYVADCDVRGKAYTVPELAAALSNISDRVRVVPMADDESGTCIVEMPDVILDASVSTQLHNIREVLDSTGFDMDQEGQESLPLPDADALHLDALSGELAAGTGQPPPAYPMAGDWAVKGRIRPAGENQAK